MVQEANQRVRNDMQNLLPELHYRAIQTIRYVQRDNFLTNGEWKLEGFLKFFWLQDNSQKEVRDFVSQHAEEFTVLCPDGLCPPRWKQLHNEYRARFEYHFNVFFLFDEERANFVEYCRQLHAFSSAAPDGADLSRILLDGREFQGLRGIRASDFRSFFIALIASEDFERFQRMMFNAALRQRAGAGQAAGLTT
eukprot:CAMPEP_0175449190 /NCGR_PEP_ID=MMETSP0095-20121207/61715_1 /TAXON_ID=311494 /ORGANISM="Alexandrium monilatum, Strain CCMP3105" /LENGTH=193 /DNA_ID=CAMNT_0016749601 /DNA_START=82 /DNA_END=663 /DNA_ORIENTATION=+